MAAIIIAIVVVMVLAIITMKAQAEASAIFNPGGTKEHAKYTWWILCHDRIHTTGNHQWNRTNAVLCMVFTSLSIIMLDTGFTVAGIMQHNGTEVHGMGWVLVWFYALGTVGSMAYAVGCGAHVMNRADSRAIMLPVSTQRAVR